MSGGWLPKTSRALVRGTNQMTENFEKRKNWVLGLWGNQ